MTELLTTGNAVSNCNSNAFEKVWNLCWKKFRGLNLTEFSLPHRLPVSKKYGQVFIWLKIWKTFAEIYPTIPVTFGTLGGFVSKFP